MPLTMEQKRKLKTEKKEQKLREAAELRIKTKKDELAKEVSTSQGVLANKMKLWYTHNYATRFPLLKDEMEIAWHSYEHTLDVKDFIIWQLQARIDEARIQEAMSWQDYVIKVDNMIDDYHTRVDNLDKHYQDLVKCRMDDAMAEFKEREMSQTNLEDYYKTVLYIMDEQSLDVSAAVQGEYLTKRDEEAKRGLHLTEFMSTSLEKMIQDIATAIKDCLQEYKDTTESRKREVDLLRTKDSYYLDVITRQDVRVAKLCDEMINLQSQVTEGYESRLMLEDLKRDREETYNEYKHVRANLNRASSLDATQLLTLTTHSNNSIKHLERVLEKGEKIVRLGVLCRDLETQEEKNVPFGMSYVKFKDLTDTDEPFVLFWRRFASVNLRKRKLESTLKKLQDENKWLKMQLKTAIDMLQFQFTCLKIET